MPWIKTIPFAAATGRLKTLYDRVVGPNDALDTIMMVHGLRPHSLEGHMAIYKAVLHHKDNTTPKWFLEVLGVWVSSLNACSYCVDHHFAGLKRLLRDDAKADAIRAAIEARDIAATPLTAAQHAAVRYAQRLTETPSEMTETDAKALLMAGWQDAEVLEINQVVAYFAYANRTVLGLGCSTEGEILGLSPGNSDDPDDWGHH